MVVLALYQSRGILRIERIELIGADGVALYTRGAAPGGGPVWGYVRLPGHAPDAADFDALRGTQSQMMSPLRRVSGDWFLLYDGYRSVKLGWS